MAVEDGIVTVKDVKDEGTITDNTVNKNINYRIPISIEKIIYSELRLEKQKDIQKILDDKIKSLDLKWAIVYDVLAWLESKGKIDPADQVVTVIRDAQATVQFGSVQSVTEKPKSYAALSEYYISRLKPSPPIGGKPRFRGNYHGCY